MYVQQLTFCIDLAMIHGHFAKRPNRGDSTILIISKSIDNAIDAILFASLKKIIYSNQEYFPMKVKITKYAMVCLRESE